MGKSTKSSKGSSEVTSKTSSRTDSSSREDEKSKPPAKMSPRQRCCMERTEILSRPTARRLRCLWDEKGCYLPRERRDKIKSALEDDYFLSPEQTEQYFQSLGVTGPWPGPPGAMAAGEVARKEANQREKDLRQRQKWLVDFSSQVAYHLCDFINKNQKDILVSNRLRAIADVVLERVADILGEPKPTRNNPGRLPRFMVAVSDRIAVWIENAVYRAQSGEEGGDELDDHMRLDAPAEKPPVCPQKKSVY